MRRRAWAGVALGVGLAALRLGGGGPPPGTRPALAELLGAGAPEALFADTAEPPALRFDVPLAGEAALVVELAGGADVAARDAVAALLLRALLGVPGEWPLGGSAATGAPRLVGIAAAAAAVPEPSPRALVLLGLAGLAAARRAPRPVARAAGRRAAPPSS